MYNNCTQWKSNANKSEKRKEKVDVVQFVAPSTTTPRDKKLVLEKLHRKFYAAAYSFSFKRSAFGERDFIKLLMQNHLQASYLVAIKLVVQIFAIASTMYCRTRVHAIITVPT